jgi:hypothetical protein
MLRLSGPIIFAKKSYASLSGGGRFNKALMSSFADIINAVSPSLFLISGSAPAASNTRTRSISPYEANISAVLPE